MVSSSDPEVTSTTPAVKVVWFMTNDMNRWLTNQRTVVVDGLTERLFAVGVIVSAVDANVGRRLHVDNGGERRRLLRNPLLLWREEIEG